MDDNIVTALLVDDDVAWSRMQYKISLSNYANTYGHLGLNSEMIELTKISQMIPKKAYFLHKVDSRDNNWI